MAALVVTILISQLSATFATAGESIPLLGYGTANILDAEPILEAISSGYRLLDTAALYRNQRAVGEAISRSGRRREELYIVTKVGFWPGTYLHPLLSWLRTWVPSLESFVHASKGYEGEGLEAALRELGVDYVDLCLVHSPVTSVSEFLLSFVPHRFGRIGGFQKLPRWLGWPAGRLLSMADFVLGGSTVARQDARAKSWRALELAKQRGICREIGVSNYAVSQLEELEQYAIERPRVNQLEAHPRFVPRDVLAFCRERGIHVIGYGNGLSIGEGMVLEVAQELARSASQVSLRWATQRNITVLPRSSNAARIAENAALFDFEIPPRAMARLDALDEGLPFYWDSSVLWTGGAGDRTSEL